MAMIVEIMVYKVIQKYIVLFHNHVLYVPIFLFIFSIQFRSRRMKQQISNCVKMTIVPFYHVHIPTVEINEVIH